MYLVVVAVVAGCKWHSNVTLDSSELARFPKGCEPATEQKSVSEAVRTPTWRGHVYESRLFFTRLIHTTLGFIIQGTTSTEPEHKHGLYTLKDRPIYAHANLVLSIDGLDGF